MSFDSISWFNSAAGTFSGGHQGQAFPGGYGFGQNNIPSYSDKDYQRNSCYLCAEQISVQRLLPSSITSLVTVPDFTAGLSFCFQNTQFQQNACTACASMGRLSHFIQLLTELEERILVVKGHVEAHVVAHQQLLARAQVQGQAYETTSTIITRASRARSRQNATETLKTGPSSLEQYIVENVLGAENDMSSSQNSGATEEFPANEVADNTNTQVKQKQKTLRKRTKSASYPRAKRTKVRYRTRENDALEYECSVCKKAFKTKARLDSHFLIHSGEKPFKCTVCDKAFRHNPALFLHMKRHGGERKYKCNICGHGFVTKWKAKDHELNHTQEKSHKCPHCDFTSSRSNYVLTHIERAHPEFAEKPVVRQQCPSCPKTFRTTTDLKKHEITIHRADEKPMCCDQCGKKYTDLHSLNRHIREVHQGNRRKPKAPYRYPCVTCGKLCVTPSALSKHALSHDPKEDRERLKCPRCPRSFLCKRAFRDHKIRHETGVDVKPRKNRPSRRQARLLKECRTRGTNCKIFLTRVDGVDADEERRQRLLRRVRQRTGTHYEVEDKEFESDDESAWSGQEDDVVNTPSPPESKVEVFEGFVPDVLYKNSEDGNQGSESGAHIEDTEEIKLFVNPTDETPNPNLQ